MILTDDEMRQVRQCLEDQAGIVDYAQTHPVVAAAIDAQLTWAANLADTNTLRAIRLLTTALLPQ